MKKLFLILTHLLAGFIGFAAGIYALPILIAPDAPSASQVASMAAAANYQTTFRKDLQDSDFLHQAEGQVTVSDQHITFNGTMSPGPDYILYLSPQFVETEADFNQLKPQMTPVAAVKTFDNFIIDVPTGVDVEAFNTVIVWCESFGQFITAAKYR